MRDIGREGGREGWMCERGGGRVREGKREENSEGGRVGE